MKTYGLLPIAGQASRLGGLPKFLLPISDSGTSLLAWHIRQLGTLVDEILLPTRPVFIPVLETLSLGSNIHLMPMETASLSETVKNCETILKGADVLFGMPDTYFDGGSPYLELSKRPSGSLSVATWKTRPNQVGSVGSTQISGDRVLKIVDKDPNQDFGFHWGALRFSFSDLAHLNPNSETVGDMVQNSIDTGRLVTNTAIEGRYFDCGTLSGYKELLNTCF